MDNVSDAPIYKIMRKIVNLNGASLYVTLDLLPLIYFVYTGVVNFLLAHFLIIS
jgi:hypothetical protein